MSKQGTQSCEKLLSAKITTEYRYKLPKLKINKRECTSHKESQKIPQMNHGNHHTIHIIIKYYYYPIGFFRPYIFYNMIIC